MKSIRSCSTWLQSKRCPCCSVSCVTKNRRMPSSSAIPKRQRRLLQSGCALTAMQRNSSSAIYLSRSGCILSIRLRRVNSAVWLQPMSRRGESTSTTSQWLSTTTFRMRQRTTYTESAERRGRERPALRTVSARNRMCTTFPISKSI